jgi:hypothetical protein
MYRSSKTLPLVFPGLTGLKKRAERKTGLELISRLHTRMK